MKATQAPLMLEGRLRLPSRRREGQALVLQGEAGIGKTHTSRNALLALSYRSVTIHANISARALARALPSASKLAAWAETALGKAARGEYVAVQALQDALAEQLVALSPFVLHIEDLHETTEAKCAFWSALARTAPRLTGVTLLGTTRGAPLAGFEVVHLAPLDEHESGLLLESEAKAPLPTEAKRWVYDWARGNPLFTLEYFRALARNGNLWSDGRRWRWREPQTDLRPLTVETIIEDVLTSVDADPDATLLLDALALLPATATVQRASALTNMSAERVEMALRILERRGILNSGVFTHPLYREVHRAHLPPDRARVFAVQVLKNPAVEAETAVHFLEFVDISREEALRVLTGAMDAASARGNDAGAAAHAWRASQWLGGVEGALFALRAAQLARRVNVVLASGYARAAYAAHPTLETLSLLTVLLAQVGQGEEAAALLEARREHSPAWYDAWIEVLVQRGDLHGAMSAWHAAAPLQDDMSALTQGLMASAYLNLGKLTEARELAQAGLARPGVHGAVRARFLNVLGGVHYFQGEYDLGEACQAEAIGLHLQEARFVEAAGLYGNRALTRSAQGRLEDAMLDLEESLRLLTLVGDGRQFAFQQQRLGALHARAGAFERAEELLLEAREVLARSDALGWLAECESELTKLYLEWGPPGGEARAARHAQRALKLARQVRVQAYLTDALFVAAWAAAARREVDEAFALVEELQALATGGPRVVVCYTTWARGLALEAAGQPQAALTALREAAQQLHAANIDVLAWRVQFEVARLSHDAELARRGVQYFEARGMHGRAAPGHRYLVDLSGNGRPMPHTSQDAGSSGRYRLLMLGTLELHQHGQSQALRGRQARSLLAHLGQACLAGRSEVPQLELVDVLYPGQHESRGVAALQQLVHRLRDMFGPGLVVSTPVGYALGADISIDAQEFLRTGNLQLWRGPFLDGPEGDVRLQARLQTALHEAAWACLTQDPASAARAGELLLATDPYDLRALRLTLMGLRATRAHRRLTRVYAEARERFQEVGERLPESWQAFMAQSRD